MIYLRPLEWNPIKFRWLPHLLLMLTPMEMMLSDDYRQIDRELYPHKYLFKCRQKLMTKVKEYRSRVHELEKEVA